MPSFPLAADSMMAAAARVRSPAASFLAPAATGIVFHRTPDATAEPVVPAVPEFDPAQVVRSRPKEVDEPLGEVVLKLPPPPQVVEYELPEYADETEEAAATAAPAARTVVVEEFARAESAPVEPVPAFAGDITATPGVADLLGAADQFLDTLGAALADPTAPVALWERVGYWAVSIGAVGVALEVARQRLRVRSPHTEAPTLVVRQ
ncbi:hypothetical protein [Gemmata sp.]|uniref:hypothetical protein n=1 Tax=Gemmata sp. TaxID=1914242 RepID=UPI003F6F6BE7